ncbi:putative F-box domain, leucine-rich repeat domain superfamily, F-box-like domain superfamily [Helianthus annuus]|nr:putative F-box domain, leucine-rich repeat domain superfamily, F-box-like domain superfamily [Helianthus annuus]
MKPEYAERMALDRISTLPQPILETVLSLLSTEEAARTSILSKEWRYRWTTIPNLEFTLRKRFSDQKSDEESVMKYMDVHDLHQVLLLRQGPIHKLTLSMEGYWEDDDLFEFEQIILHLSRNHIVRKLELDASELESLGYKLPISVFALHHLKELDLFSFTIELPSIFNGFGSLVKLNLTDVKLSTKTLRRLLSNCPSLESLHVDIDESDDECTINELLKCLPVIEELSISSDVCEWLVLDSDPQELPISLVHLKVLHLEGMSFTEDSKSAFLLVLIKCSPNLERICLNMAWRSKGDEEYPAVKNEYSNVWLEHLKELEISFWSRSHGMELLMEFGKFILVRSPKLKKVSIFGLDDKCRESMIVNTLLGAPRASPAVNFKINYPVPWSYPSTRTTPV